LFQILAIETFRIRFRLYPNVFHIRSKSCN